NNNKDTNKNKLIQCWRVGIELVKHHIQNNCRDTKQSDEDSIAEPTEPLLLASLGKEKFNNDNRDRDAPDGMVDYNSDSPNPVNSNHSSIAEVKTKRVRIKDGVKNDALFKQAIRQAQAEDTTPG